MKVIGVLLGLLGVAAIILAAAFGGGQPTTVMPPSQNDDSPAATEAGQSTVSPTKSVEKCLDDEAVVRLRILKEDVQAWVHGKAFGPMLQNELERLQEDIDDLQRAGCPARAKVLDLEDRFAELKAKAVIGQVTQPATPLAEPEEAYTPPPPTTYTPPSQPSVAGQRYVPRATKLVLQLCEEPWLVEIWPDGAGNFQIPAQYARAAMNFATTGDVWADIGGPFGPTSEGLKTDRSSCLDNRDAYDIYLTGNGWANPFAITMPDRVRVNVHRYGWTLYFTYAP